MSSTSELNYYERFVLVTNILGDFIVKSTSFVDSEAILDRRLVQDALTRMQFRHPLLRSSIELNPDKQARYVENNNLIGKFELDWEDFPTLAPSRDEIVQKLTSFNSKLIVFDTNSLLWRFMVLSYRQDSRPKYCFNLSVALPCTDGINISTLMVEFVNVVNCMLTNTRSDVMTSEFELSPSMHSICEREKLFGGIQETTLDRIRKMKKFKFVLPEMFATKSSSGLKINWIKIDKDRSGQIIEKSKRFQTRVTGFLTTAAFYALKQLYDENGLEFPTRCSAEIPANLRLRTRPNLSFANMRLQVVLGLLETDSDNFGEFKNIWKDASYVQSRIQSCTDIESGEFFTSSHDYQLLDELSKLAFEVDDVGQACEKIHPFNMTDLLVSNVGPHVYERVERVNGPVKIREIYFGDSLASNPRILPALMFHVIFWDGEIFIELSSNLSAIGAQFVDRYVGIFEDVISKSLTI